MNVFHIRNLKNLEIEHTVQHKFGGLKCGISIPEKNICYIGMRRMCKVTKQRKGELLEFNIATKEISRYLSTKDGVF